MKTRKRIERLTAAQTARFGEYVERWTAIGLSTEPADRPTAEAAIATMYRCGGLEPPQHIVWCKSPLSMLLTAAVLRRRDSVRATVRATVRDSVEDSVGASVGASVRASVRDSVGASVGASVRDSVGASVGATVRDSVRDSVEDSVGASVGASVWDSVWDSVRDSVWDSVGASVRDSVGATVRDSVEDSVGASVGASVRASVEDSVWDSVWGQHEAYWLAFYAYFREVCGIEEETKQLDGLLALSKSAGWALPYRDICFVSERHTTLLRDERGRLHAEDGPAVRYPDGWAVWAWHGVRVPQEVIEQPETLSVTAALGEPNTEVRRVMLTRIGADRLSAELPAGVIDSDVDGRGMPRRLFTLGDITDRRFIAYTCPSTGREYPAQPVPPQVDTCAEAVAWRFGALDINEFGNKTKQFDYTPSVEG